ncbi:4Fe-4S dicluster domain-containing protein [Mangrovicella endophytica]|uniref:4Fe-4S dicluster domain-containing protein n=1 Tax=Mangrovicella endophytica TaxID=2066697 RepID=UPI000C9EA810|nr:4Fe-4S dicluster domain-containing protein [Mangrovicella endophytica]
MDWQPRAAFVGGGEPQPAIERPDEFVPAARTAPLDRRTLLKLLGLSAAIPLAACAPPAEEIVPYVEMPQGLLPSVPRAYATAFELGGIGTGVLATSHEGRPTKIEGNPDHPGSRGGTDAFAQGSILSLYDPGRASLVRHRGQIASIDAFHAAVAERQSEWLATGGEGLRVLTGATASPTFHRLKQALQNRFPKMGWHAYEPLGAENARGGAALAFGRRLQAVLEPGEARVIVSLDADFVGPGPEQARLARGFARRRIVRRAAEAGAGEPLPMARLHVAEPTMTATGASADERLGVRRSRIDAVARAIAAGLGLPVEAPALAPREAAFAAAAVRDLRAAGPRALITVGEAQPPHVHALALAVNGHLGAIGTTLRLAVPGDEPRAPAASIADLAADIRRGAVSALLILGGNPAYDAPADLDFEAALRSIRFSARLGLYEDETSDACLWHVPQLHPLEEWSDTIAADGTAAVVQPLVTPLFEGHSPLAILAALGGRLDIAAYDAVREHWRFRLGEGGAAPAGAVDERFEAAWRQALSEGVISGTAGTALVAVGAATLPVLPPLPGADTAAMEITFHPDPSVWDGRFANNAWLQETPKPVTGLVWGNAASIAPGDQRRLGIADGDEIAVEVDGTRIVIPQIAVPGQAEGSIALTLGYGRRAGSIARGVGTDVTPLRRSDRLWQVSGATVGPTGVTVELAVPQGSHAMEGRDIVRTRTVAQVEAEPPRKAAPRKPATLYPEYPAGPYEWAMVIDQTLCIACNACVVACQAENNVPVVGPEEIRRGRDMHWLRIDSYFAGSQEAPRVVSQPVPCMHCEKAPCEPMCPVEASVHDSEGLNVQVYNRCIGTRDCQSNCPYKVRRFNYFGYANGQEFADLGEPILHAARNPDVTVRSRGVMEKCTYCVQRISGARRAAEREHRTIADGEVITACSQACPTEAIRFGNRSDQASEVNALRREPHHYALLEELGTRPRTTYLARVENPAAVEAGAAHPDAAPKAGGAG